jgi:hypothetical protein
VLLVQVHVVVVVVLVVFQVLVLGPFLPACVVCMPSCLHVACPYAIGSVRLLDCLPAHLPVHLPIII